jgi:uncharacterized repeat protein (TIGR03987 family)
MSPILIGAVTTILVAAVIYTIAVFAEQRSGVLKPWHLALFWLGLIFDTTGTTLMSKIAGGFEFNIHGVLGVAAIVLMLIHAGWATIAITFKQEGVLKNFHTFSTHVWGLWMLSLVSGFVLAVPGILASRSSTAENPAGASVSLIRGMCPLRMIRA